MFGQRVCRNEQASGPSPRQLHPPLEVLPSPSRQGVFKRQLPGGILPGLPPITNLPSITNLPPTTDLSPITILPTNPELSLVTELPTNSELPPVPTGLPSLPELPSLPSTVFGDGCDSVAVDAGKT